MYRFSSAACVAIACCVAGPAAGQALPQGEALKSAIAARDSELFDTVFLRCEPKRLEAMLDPSFEMYHDKDGVVARSARDLVEGYAKDCAAAAQAGAWRSRRELVTATLRVHPVPGYGAIEEGDHVFYERKGDGPERLAGRAHFVHLWRLAPDGWRLARAFSYGHGAAD